LDVFFNFVRGLSPCRDATVIVGCYAQITFHGVAYVQI